MSKPKIFCFINGGHGTDWVYSVGLAEDGAVLAGHVSSSEHWAAHDIGVTSEWKHDKYQEHYPEGFEIVDLIWATRKQLEADADFQAAIALNRKQREEVEDYAKR